MKAGSGYGFFQMNNSMIFDDEEEEPIFTSSKLKGRVIGKNRLCSGPVDYRERLRLWSS